MNIAVIFAGGVGNRMHSKVLPKQFLEIYKKPIIIHTLEHFERHPEIDAIVVACVEGWIDYLKELLEKFKITKVKKIVKGGQSGQESIYRGLIGAKELAGEEPSIVLIHDGVRPLINRHILSENIGSVKTYGSAVTTAQVKETIILVNDNDSESAIQQVIDRNRSRAARAPQSFWLNDILEAHTRALEEGRTDFIDSCTMMHHYGKNLHLVEGPSENIKITTPDDFYSLRAILEAQENAQLYGIDK